MRVHNILMYYLRFYLKYGSLGRVGRIGRVGSVSRVGRVNRENQNSAVYFPLEINDYLFIWKN